MSGGSYDYICFKLEELSESIRNQDIDPRRASFSKLLKLISVAMHDIEWVDSCDYSQGDDHKAIDAVFSFLGSDPETIKQARSFDELKIRLQEYLK